MLRQEAQPAARGVVDRCRRERYKEMQKKAQNIGACASLKSSAPQQARGNCARNPWSKGDERAGQVKETFKQAPTPIASNAFRFSTLHDAAFPMIGFLRLPFRFVSGLQCTWPSPSGPKTPSKAGSRNAS
jgi:hypothetical protein